MNDDTNDRQLYNLSRRKVLGGLGAVGLASAGAGLGTSAYFTDTESFTGNTLAAGELDLKLDYKSTYTGGPGRLEDIQAMGYPDAEDLGDGRYLLAQTPRPGDGMGWEDYLPEFDFCAPENDQYLVNGDGISIFHLEDVKPGDSGEMTVSIHICDNPAWLEMGGELSENADNTMSEPESEVDSTPDAGELADAIEVTVWYDEDCDNVYEPTGTGEQQELEVALVSDVSGSMSQEIGDLKSAAKGFVDNLSSPDEAAAISFSDGSSLDQQLTTNYQTVKDAIDQYTSGGGTDMDQGISTAETELISGANATSGASKVMIVLTDGQPSSQQAATTAAMNAKQAGIRIFTIALGSGAATSYLENNIASSPGDAYVAPDPSDLDTVYSEIAQVVLAGEQLIAQGSLADVMALLAGGVELDGDRTEEGRQPYPGNTTQCIGFEWVLPTDVENEVQTDSVAFNVDFTATQYRHNPQTTTTAPQ
ncbi:VWA domain-containing protein [Salarchaeum sp. JOR-1]|uniref:vWA domain-containing protein n=1 Tax=Salarchaeum sp. JOR-1 TaxID=2599399 RepID=UPI001198389E|nr:vWA domain-containing protein [Salarchaeum sp. JOR-1]QDX39994.1 VWA domain-containing protein [Salarchaeum sp. JOR-1]